MTDRLAELGALQYAVENLSTAGTNPNRLGLAGYIHAAYTDYQTWAAANPGVNPNRLSARGRLYGYFYDNASWSPSSLFANSEVGAWYDPSDLSTMFQDIVGTTPVTADGQTVGKILDKSGRGNHATAPSDAARPLYKTDGTYHWLQFDGVDDLLSTAAIDFTSTDKASVFFGSSTSSTTNQGVAYFGSAGNPGEFNALYAAGSNPAMRSLAIGSTGTSAITVSGDAANTKAVYSHLFDLAGAIATDEIKNRKNATLPTQTVVAVGPAGGGNFGNWQLSISNLTFHLAGNIYSLIIRGALSTTQEITDTETWVNSKTGAY